MSRLLEDDELASPNRTPNMDNTPLPAADSADPVGRCTPPPMADDGPPPLQLPPAADDDPLPPPPADDDAPGPLPDEDLPAPPGLGAMVSSNVNGLGAFGMVGRANLTVTNVVSEAAEPETPAALNGTGVHWTVNTTLKFANEPTNANYRNTFVQTPAGVVILQRESYRSQGGNATDAKALNSVNKLVMGQVIGEQLLAAEQVRGTPFTGPLVGVYVVNASFEGVEANEVEDAEDGRDKFPHVENSFRYFGKTIDVGADAPAPYREEVHGNMATEYLYFKAATP